MLPRTPRHWLPHATRAQIWRIEAARMCEPHFRDRLRSRSSRKVGSADASAPFDRRDSLGDWRGGAESTCPFPPNRTQECRRRVLGAQRTRRCLTLCNVRPIPVPHPLVGTNTGRSRAMPLWRRSRSSSFAPLAQRGALMRTVRPARPLGRRAIRRPASSEFRQERVPGCDVDGARGSHRGRKRPSRRKAEIVAPWTE